MKRSILVVGNSIDECRKIAHALENPVTEFLFALSADEAIMLHTKHLFCLAIVYVAVGETGKVQLLKTLQDARLIPILALVSELTSQKRAFFLHKNATAALDKECMDIELQAQARTLIDFYFRLNTQGGQSLCLAFGMDFIIDYLRHQVILNGELLNFPRKEFEILYSLASHPNQVMSAEQLYDHVWPNESNFNADTSIKNHIMRIRKRLSKYGKEYIRNIWGVGYSFVYTPGITENAEQKERKDAP